MAEIALPLMGQGDDLYDEIIRENLSKRILIFNENVTDAVIENYILYITGSYRRLPRAADLKGGSDA